MSKITIRYKDERPSVNDFITFNNPSKQTH